MSLITDIADNYQREYGFMALNATYQNAKLFAKIHDEQTVEELGLVRDELIRRGVRLIASEEEYNTGIADHGLPPAFTKASP